MFHAVSIWLLTCAFCGAGLVNAMGAAGAKRNFARWGYPHWWCYITGGLEVIAAVLIALPSSRAAGLVVGGAIIAAAALTVLLRREYAHLAPLGVFIALLALVEVSS